MAPFSPRRFTNETAVQCAEKLNRSAVCLNVSCLLWWYIGDRHGTSNWLDMSPQQLQSMSLWTHSMARHWCNFSGWWSLFSWRHGAFNGRRRTYSPAVFYRWCSLAIVFRYGNNASDSNETACDALCWLILSTWLKKAVKFIVCGGS